MALSCRKLTIILCCALGTGCSNLGYYAHSISGQAKILAKRQPISELLEDPQTPAALTARLDTIMDIRDFASHTLVLPDNGSYRSYVELNRRYVIWNVFATPELAIEPVKWCFPIAGCVSYRGYFSGDRANRYAEKLRDQNHDVYVAGVAAYSTLGWFDDPVLNTILDRPEPDIAGLIFHELAHQKLYVKDDTSFNESFATAVELEGIRRWLQHIGASSDYTGYMQRKQRRQDFVEFLMGYRHRLREVYDSPVTDAQKREAKARLFSELKSNYRQLKDRWGGYGGYDRWFAQDLNNAHLASIGAYHRYVPAFQALLKKLNGDLPAFYREAGKLGTLPPEQRELALNALGGRHTGSGSGP